MNARAWNREDVFNLAKSYQPACILAAAADLEVFDALREGPIDATGLARRQSADPRGMTILLDALAALGLLLKDGTGYTLAPGLDQVLAAAGPVAALAAVQHQANCLRRWALLSEVVRSGRPVQRRPSIRGESADQAAFIGAMDNLSAPVANEVVSALGDLPYTRVLDLGGASGTWTIALLRRRPTATAILFDLPPVIPMARQRLTAAGLSDRVQLVAGDFMTDPLPGGTDLAWVSAIVHQNSREQNRRLFASLSAVLAPGGHVVIRDVVMDETRTAPAGGALFAVNMLVATDGGGTFTLGELAEDLQSAGFAATSLLRRDDWMNSLVLARRP